MSAYVVSPKHLAVIANVAVKPFASAEFLEKFFEAICPMAYATDGLHSIDEEFRKELQGFKFATTFRKENFTLLTRILAKAIVIGVNTAYPKREQTDLNEYLERISAMFEESKQLAESIKYMQFLKLLHCYEFQTSELQDFEKTLAYQFLQLVYKHGCYIMSEEYDNCQWAI